MRWQKVATLVATILVVVIAAGILFPIYADHAVLGLDLQGGVMVRLEAPEGTEKRKWKPLNLSLKIVSMRWVFRNQKCVWKEQTEFR